MLRNAMLPALLLGLAGLAFGAEAIVDEASAVAAAKRYTKAQCAGETPCTYKARREGKQWNVWVQFTKRSAPGKATLPYPGGHVLLYFDREGNLVRRVEGE
jgi:hypothetical protein